MSLYIDKQTFETALPAIDSNRWKDDVIEPKHQGERFLGAILTVTIKPFLITLKMSTEL